MDILASFCPLFWQQMHFFPKQYATKKQLEFVSVFERFIAALCLNLKAGAITSKNVTFIQHRLFFFFALALSGSLIKFPLGSA